MEVGDIGSGALVPSNSVIRSFVSYTLPPIPAGYKMTNATIMLYQIYSWQGGGGGFPQWACAGGDTVDCIVSHINYGEELDFGDWEKGDIGNPYTLNHNVGVITAEGMSIPNSHGETGPRYLDVTDCVQIDYILGNVHTQYRIAFEIETDYDDRTDAVAFSTADGALPNQYPRLYFTYWDGVSVNDEETTTIDNMNIFPQPVRETTTIQFQLKQAQYVTIEIYDIRGRNHMQTNTSLSDGKHEIPLNFQNLASGVYLLRMQTNAYSTTKKILHLQ